MAPGARLGCSRECRVSGGASTRRLPDPRDRPLLKPGELEGFIPGMRRSAIYEAIRRGDLPSVRIGSRVFLANAEIRRLFRIEDDSPATQALAGEHGTPDDSEAGVRTPAVALTSVPDTTTENNRDPRTPRRAG
jgi:predicted DNA-binding transcriptional regulator AlpA